MRYNKPIFGNVFSDTDTEMQKKEFFIGKDFIKEEFQKKIFNIIFNETIDDSLKAYIDEKNEIILMIKKDFISTDRLKPIEIMQKRLTQRPRNPAILAGDSTLSGNTQFEHIEMKSGIKISRLNPMGLAKFKELDVDNGIFDINLKSIIKNIKDLDQDAYLISDYTPAEHKILYKREKKRSYDF